MEAIIGVWSLIAEGLVDVIGGTELVSAAGASITTILDALEQDGFTAVQEIMQGFSQNDIYNIVSSIEGEYPAITLSRSFYVGGMSPGDLLSKLNIIGSKLAKKGIDIASTQGKQLMVDLFNQFSNLVKEHGASAITNIAISGAAGFIGQKIAEKKYNDQNENKIDLNSSSQNTNLGEANTLSTKS